MRIFLSMAVIVSAIWLAIAVMIYGWGLEPQSWFIVIGGVLVLSYWLVYQPFSHQALESRGHLR